MVKFRQLNLMAEGYRMRERMDIIFCREESKVRICDAVKAAAMVKRRQLPKQRTVEPKLTADAVISKSGSNAMVKTTEKVVAVGASTGGTEALRVFMEALPLDAHGTVVVQHMPENFTASFADRLNTLCRVSVSWRWGGDRYRLTAKVFGGAHLLNAISKSNGMGKKTFNLFLNSSKWSVSASSPMKWGGMHHG